MFWNAWLLLSHSFLIYCFSLPLLFLSISLFYPILSNFLSSSMKARSIFVWNPVLFALCLHSFFTGLPFTNTIFYASNFPIRPTFGRNFSTSTATVITVHVCLLVSNNYIQKEAYMTLSQIVDFNRLLHDIGEVHLFLLTEFLACNRAMLGTG